MENAQRVHLKVRGGELNWGQRVNNRIEVKSE